jgi:hypothetical protein
MASNAAASIVLEDLAVQSAQYYGSPITEKSTYPSAMISQVDLKEFGTPSARFIYNFFVPDENINNASETAFFPTTTNLESLRYFYYNNSAGSSAIPRFVEINVPLPGSSFNLDGLGSGVILSENLSKISFEETFGSNSSSGLFFQETKAANFIYTHLSSSAVFSGVDLSDSSLAQAGNIMNSRINPVTLAEKKQSLVDMISNVRQEGHHFIDSSGRELESNVLANIASVKVGSSISNLMLGEIVQIASEDPFSVFFEEMSASRDSANSIQARSRSSKINGQISVDEFDVDVNPVSVTTLSPGNLNVARRSSPIGMLIEKREISPDGNIVERDPIVVDNLDVRKIVDPAVKYGYTYVYVPRIVYIVECEAVARDSTGQIADQACLLEILIASRGTAVSVSCEETVPPPPPYDLRFNRDDLTGNLQICWDFPPNSQRDIKYFQVFRRDNIDSPFRLLAMHDFNDAYSRMPLMESVPGKRIVRQQIPINVFDDPEFSNDKKFIYAVVAVDAHGYSSNYSAQFEISFDRFKGRLNRILVSRSGAPKTYPNFFLNLDTFVDAAKDSNSTRMRVFYDPEYYSVRDPDGNIINVVKTDSSNPVYKIDILNTDLQQSQTLNVNVSDRYIESSTTAQALGPAIQAQLSSFR